MAGAPFPPDWHDVVRQHFGATVGYVAAQSGTCLEFQTKESRPPRGRVPGRDFKPLSPNSLPELRPPASWFLGVILCPGDDVAPIAKWHSGLKAPQRDRVVLFVHPEFRSGRIATAWAEAGGPLPQVVPLPPSWERFHRIYGRLHGDRVYLDHAPPRFPK